MPDPNQNDPNSSQSTANSPQTTAVPTVSDTTQTIVSNPSAVDSQPMPSFVSQSDLPPLPPDFQNVANSPVPPAPATTTTVTETTTTSTEPVTQNGSAAPSEIPSMVSGPKKKFGGTRIIATILGIFLLVGGVGAGIILTQQQQVAQPKAVGAGGCVCADPKSGLDAGSGNCQSDGSCDCGSNKVKNNKCSSSSNPNPGSGSACAAGSASKCSGKNGGDIVDTCWQSVAGDGHNQSLQCQLGTGNVCSAVAIKTDNSCGTNNGNINTTTGTPGCIFDNWSKTNVCEQVNGVWDRCAFGGTPVGEMGYLETSTSPCAGDYTIRGSAGVGGGTYCLGAAPKYSCTPTALPNNKGCVKDNTCAPPSGTPTPPPSPTASCQNIKAYSATWTALTAAQLSSLAAGTSINFCATGTASSGSFDQAKFTINTVVQAVTSTKGQGAAAGAFCQTYTILPTDTTVNVSAQIHHVTLGWK